MNAMKKSKIGLAMLLFTFFVTLGSTAIGQLGGNWEDKKKHHRACHAMAMTSVGIPIVYYGA